MESEAALDYYINTLPTLHADLASAQGAVESIQHAVAALPLKDRLLVTLGGEHSLTPGVVAALAPRYDDLLIVQIDAHADLRDTFDGTPWSHACAMRRCLDFASILQFGIRSVCQEEVTFMQATDRVRTWTAESLWRDREKKYLEALRNAVNGRNVYLTIDVDGLDPSIIPATGTPEPGGIGWYDTLEIIQTVAQHSHVVAFDCVELAPIPGGHASAFAAAKLVYKTMNAVMRSRRKK